MRLDKLNNGLLFARDPGAANNIAIIADELKSKNINFTLFAKDKACAVFKRYGLEYIKLNKELDIISLKEKLKGHVMTWVLTGTSADDSSDALFWEIAKENKIKSYSLLDQWVNYRIRYSSKNVDDLKDNSSFPLDHLPYKILVMDDLAKKEMIAEGISENLIEVTGHPYLSSLKENYQNLNFETIEDSRDTPLYFISEPIIETYKDTDDHSFWGYTQCSVLKDLVEALNEIGQMNNTKKKLIVKLHPKNDKQLMDQFIEEIQLENLHIEISSKLGPDEIIEQKGIIVGLSSMLMLEASLASIPILSVQTGLKREDPFILSRMGILKTITKKETLKDELIKFMNNPDDYRNFNLDFINNSSERVLKYICGECENGKISN